MCFEIVSAINAKEVKVTFSGNAEELTAQDFNVTGDLSVVDVQANGKTAIITFNKAMTDGAEYTLQLLDENDEVTSSSDFKYELGAVAEISLTKSVFEEGEKVTDSLKVFDENGIEISTADYNVIDVESSNTNVIDNDAVGTVIGTGTSNLRFEIEYKDGSKSKSDFMRVDVEKAVTAELAGFELAAVASFDNTVDYREKYSAATAETSLYLDADSDGKLLHVYADDSKGNPEVAPLDFTGNDYEVTSKTTNIVTVTQDGSGAKLTPISTGKGTIVIEGPKNYKKTITVEVKEDSEYKDLSLSATSLKLSDEAVADANGVNQDEVLLNYLDQYKEEKYFTIDNAAASNTDSGHVNKVSNEEIVISNVIEDGDKLVVSAAQTNGAFTLEGVSNDGKLLVKAVEGKTVNNASIRVSYYEDADANKYTTQKVISTTVVDVDASQDAYDYETLLDLPAIDANKVNKNTATVTAYAIDEDGNRLADVTDEVELTFAESVSNLEEEWFVFTKNPVGNSKKNAVTFATDAEKFLAESGAIKLNYTVATGNPHGTVTVSYDNSFKAPAKATVNTSPVLVDTKSTGDFNGGITVEELLFGKILANSNDLVIDDSTFVYNTANSPSIAIKKGFNGYANNPILNLLDKDGKSIVSGAEIYGLDVDTAGDGSATITGNGYLLDAAGLYDAETVFEVEYTITNDKGLDVADGVDTDAGTLDDVLSVNAQAEQASFTIVIKKVSVAGNAESYGQQVKDNNLLDAPKSVNVILNK